MSSDEETDLNVTVESNDGSLYNQTTKRKVKESIKMCQSYHLMFASWT